MPCPYSLLFLFRHLKVSLVICGLNHQAETKVRVGHACNHVSQYWDRTQVFESWRNNHTIFWSVQLARELLPGACQLSSGHSCWTLASNWTLLLGCIVSPEAYLMWGLRKNIYIYICTQFRRVENVNQIRNGLVSFPKMSRNLMLVLCPGTQMKCGV